MLWLRALRIAEKAYSHDTRRYASILTHLGQFYSVIGDYESAKRESTTVSTGHYAIEFNAEQAAHFRAQLQALKQRLLKAGSEHEITPV